MVTVRRVGEVVWEEAALFFSGFVLGIISAWAVERRRYEALVKDVEEIAAANVFIVDKLLTVLTGLCEAVNGGVFRRDE